MKKKITSIKIRRNYTKIMKYFKVYDVKALKHYCDINSYEIIK